MCPPVCFYLTLRQASEMMMMCLKDITPSSFVEIINSSVTNVRIRKVFFWYYITALLECSRIFDSCIFTLPDKF